MNNHYNTTYAKFICDLDRKVFFPVEEHPVVSKIDNNIVASDKKMLTTDYKYLSVVGDKYTVIRNEEILIPLQNQMINYFDPMVLEDVQIKDYISRDGCRCLSEYILPKMKREVETPKGFRTNIGLRFILKNTFNGSGSIVLYSGAIDFFCTNGMITGDYDVAKARHSRNFDLDGFILSFTKSIERFDNLVIQYQRWADSKLTDTVKVQQLFEKLTRTNADEPAKRSNTLSDRLFAQYIDEVQNRGNNVFALQSAMTHYASHDDERFAIRSNGDDTTLFKREEQVRKWMSSNVWNDFLENVTAA